MRRQSVLNENISLWNFCLFGGYSRARRTPAEKDLQHVRVREEQLRFDDLRRVDAGDVERGTEDGA